MTLTSDSAAAAADAVWGLAVSLRKQVEDRADKTAIIHGGRSVIFADLERRSDRVACGLAAEGVGAQDRVAFLDKNCIEYFELLYGGGKLNAVGVAVNWRLAPLEMKGVINDSGARVLFVGEEFFPHLAQFDTSLPSVTKIITFGAHPRYRATRPG